MTDTKSNESISISIDGVKYRAYPLVFGKLGAFIEWSSPEDMDAALEDLIEQRAMLSNHSASKIVDAALDARRGVKVMEGVVVERVEGAGGERVIVKMNPKLYDSVPRPWVEGGSVAEWQRRDDTIFPGVMKKEKTDAQAEQGESEQ